MKRPSKEEIRAAVEKLKEHKKGSYTPDRSVPKVEDKKPNKNRIRKQGI
ncbi:MAG: hypothetical protein HZC36_00825 [Armatimonadetes bacterium]|nr:hypothetical protein [Armatimonadota bacterium]